MPDFIVSTGFKAVDKNVTSFFNKFGLNAKTAGDKASRAFIRASKAGRSFKNITKGILAASAVKKGVSLLSRGIGTVTREFIQFDDAITGAGARFKDIGPGAKNFQQQLEAIRNRARQAGSETEFTATQSAEALDFLARAGFTSAEAMGSLSTMINLATASGEDFARVSDISSDLLGAFGLNVDDTTQKIANLTRVNDVLVKTANSANVTVEDMFETMKIAGPIATTIGAKIEEVAAVTAILGNSGIKGSIAATALKNAMLRLAAPTKAVLGGLGKLGIRTEQLQDASGNMLKFTDILKLLQPKLAKLGTRDQAAIMDAIFGKRAIAGAKNLIDNLGQIDKLETILKGAAGTAQETAEVMRQSLGNQIKTLISAATELGFKFLEAFAGEGKQGIKDLTTAIRNFDVKPIVNGLKTAFTVFKTAYTILKPFIPLILKLIAVTKVWALVQGILNATFLFNPIVAAIALIVIAITFLVKHWTTVKNAFLFGIDKIKQAFDVMFEGLKLSLFSWADVFMTTWGNIIKVILFGAAKVGAALGRDVSGLESIIDKISTAQSFVRERSGFGGGVQRLQDKQKTLLGLDTEAPNKTEAQARNINFQGQLNIAGAPPGSTVESKTNNAPPVEIAMLGVN